MKTFKFLMPFLLVAFALVGCDTDDLRNDIDELKNRVESLEAQVSAINDNVNALKVFADGGKTISSYEETESGYKLVLSDNTVLNITQGQPGQVDVPEITIQNGNWYIEGKDRGDKAVGADATIIQFTIKKYTPEGEEEGYYWYVGEKLVSDDSGKPVLATTSNNVTIEQDFFESVTVDDATSEMVLVLKNPGGTAGDKYRLPIVEGLKCAINTENLEGYKDGVLTMGFGEQLSIEVEISGGTYILTAPAGWGAELTEPQDGKATLKLTAPASASASTLSRAVADNTKDVVIQVNKGVNWAVDKIQVEAKQLVESYYQEYLAGKNLVIGKVGEDIENAFTLNKATCPEDMVVNIVADQEITEDNKVYFVKEGVTVTYNVADKINTMIIVGDKPGVKPIVKTKKVLSLSGTTSGKGLILYNIVLDATEHASYVVNIDKNEEGVSYDYLFLVDQCRIKLPSGKNFSYINNKANINAKKIVMCNTYVNVPPSSANIMIANIGGGYKYTDFVMYNNVFYSPNSTTVVEKFAVLAAASTTHSFQNIEVSNNTFINLFGANVYTKAVVKNTLKIKNNLIWNDVSSTANTYLVQALTNSDLSRMVSDDYSNNKIYSVNNLNAVVFHTKEGESVTPAGLAGNNLSKEAADPFTGGTFSWGDEKFVPGPGYETIGAHIE